MSSRGTTADHVSSYGPDKQERHGDCHGGRDGHHIYPPLDQAAHRIAVAEGELALKPSTLSAIRTGKNPKGSVLEVSRIAGINAAKHTSSLIPLCHPLALTQVGIEFAVAGKAERVLETPAWIDEGAADWGAFSIVSPH